MVMHMVLVRGIVRKNWLLLALHVGNRKWHNFFLLKCNYYFEKLMLHWKQKVILLLRICFYFTNWYSILDKLRE